MGSTTLVLSSREVIAGKVTAARTEVGFHYAFGRTSRRPDMAREFDKLVRDRIPAIIEENGEEPTTHVVAGEEYADRLVEKLAEEVAEFQERREIDELVDVLEVVHAIREERGLTTEELEARRARKADARGRFSEGIVLERVEP